MKHNVCDDIADERKKQLAKGYDAAHDDRHQMGEIALMAAAYAARAAGNFFEADILYPWTDNIPKQESQLSDLITAAALIVAEVERIIRALERHERPLP